MTLPASMPEAPGSGLFGFEVVLNAEPLAPPLGVLAAVGGGMSGGGCSASGFFFPKRLQPASARHAATIIAKPPRRTSPLLNAE